MTDLKAIAKDAAERVHKSGGCVPQLAFAPILFALQDAFPAPSPGEGDAPVAWRIRRTNAAAGFGRPQVFTTDEASEGDLKQWRRNGYDVQPLFTRPTPATPEGLREKVLIADVIRDDRATELPIFLDALEEWGCDDTTDQAKAILRFLSSEVGVSQWREDDAHG